MAKRSTRRTRVGPLRNVHHAGNKPAKAPTLNIEHPSWPRVFVANESMKNRIATILELGVDPGPVSNSQPLEMAFADLLAGKPKTEHTSELIAPVARAIDELFLMT